MENTMDKRQADINNRIEMVADNTSDTDFEQKRSDSFRIKRCENYIQGFCIP